MHQMRETDLRRQRDTCVRFVRRDARRPPGREDGGHVTSIVKKKPSPLGDLLSRLASEGVERVVFVTDGAKAEALGMHVHHLSAPKRRRPRRARLDVDPPSPPPPVWKWKTNPADVPAHLREAHDAA